MKNLTLVICLFFAGVAHAAAPATHVVFAEMWLDAHNIEDPTLRSEFIVGTLFPDIRYLGTIKRNETHEEGITPDKIRNSKSYFKAGMRLHVYVDEKRENFVKKYGIKSELGNILKDLRVNFLKMLEDEILWDDSQWKNIHEMLLVIYPEQLSYVDQSVAESWHQKMRLYLNQRPTEYLKILSANNQGHLNADEKTIKLWAEILPLYAENPYFIHYTVQLKEYLYSHF